MKSKVRQLALKAGFRSGLEEVISSQLTAAGITPEYEAFKIKFTEPAQARTYTPDFRLPNGIIVETKGRFMPADRKKHVLVKAQHPDLDIRFVFSRSKTPISKGSPTTYASWCDKNGFRYADKFIPLAWLTEPKKETP